MEDNNYNKLLKSDQKFFNLEDLILIWSESDKLKISKLVHFYQKTGRLVKLKSGLYSLIPIDQITQEHLFIIGQKIITPSYISYHTALSNYGLNFQYYSAIHLCGLYNKTISLYLGKLGIIEFVFHKLRPELFYIGLGLEAIKTEFGSYTIASKERAIIESWYLNRQIGIDNKQPKIDMTLLIKLARIYNQPRIKNNLQNFFNITI